MQPLHAVPTATTDPHVKVIDINMSFRRRWWDAIEKALNELGDKFDNDIKIFWVKNIDYAVDGWSTSHKTGGDGYVLVRCTRKGLRRYYKEVLRVTGPKRGVNDTLQPEAIECLLYEQELTDEVREMLAELGDELGVTNNLTLYRRNAPQPWIWRGKYTA